MNGLQILSRIPREVSRKANIDRGIPALREKLKTLCGTNPVNEESFSKLLPSKNPEFPNKFFRILARSKPQIDQGKLIRRIVHLVRDTDEVKLKVLFKIYDLNDDGSLSFDEVSFILKGSMAENGLNFTDNEIDQLTSVFIEEADKDDSETIDFDEFKGLLEKYDSLIECMCRSFERWMLLCPTKKTSTTKKKLSLWHFDYIRNNAQSVTFLTIYILVSIGLFFGRIGYFALQHVSLYILIARGSGMLLNFNCSLIMIFILRRSMTRLRILGLASYLPLDKNLKYHKYCGYIIFFAALLHSVAHLLNYASMSNQTGKPYVQLIFSTHPETFTFFFGAANITGWICLGALIIIVISSLPFVRKSGHFEVFAYFHLFYAIFWPTLLLHGPKFWIWLLVPGILFLVERLLYFYQMMGDAGHSYIIRGRVLPSKVSHIAIRRPKNFDYQPGDWVFIKIPSISSWEWHPFTISSAPEMPDVIFLHIRSAGQWTNRLHSLLMEQEEVGMRRFSPIKHRDIAISIPPTPKSTTKDSSIISTIKDSIRSKTSIKSKGSISSTELNETSFMIHQRKIGPTPTGEDHPSLNYSQVIRDLTDRLGSIVSSNASNDFRVIQFTRPIGRCCDDDDEARFYTLEDNNHVKTLQATSMITGEKVIYSSTPINKGSSRRSAKSSIQSSFKNQQGTLIRTTLELPCQLDGPYGSPSSHIFKTEHAIMVATGIGVTPFASILQSIMFRYAKSKNICPNCNHSWSDPIPADVMRLKKVDFIWVNRDQKSFEWFVHLLTQLEMTQAQIDDKNRFLDIHIFITSALDAADIRALGLQLALGLMHQKKERDLITGLRTRTKPGRPDWNEMFDKIKAKKKGKVSLFYCGAPLLGKQLKSICDNYGFRFHKETFS